MIFWLSTPNIRLIEININLFARKWCMEFNTIRRPYLNTSAYKINCYRNSRYQFKIFSRVVCYYLLKKTNEYIY